MTALTPHEALIYAMVMASAVDRTMSDGELARIGEIVQHLPVFDGFDPERLIAVAQDCTALVSGTRVSTSRSKSSATRCRRACATQLMRWPSRSSPQIAGWWPRNCASCNCCATAWRWTS